MENPVIILGAKGPGLQALETFQSNNVLVYGMLEDDQEWHGKEFNSVTILGATDDEGFLKIIGKKCNAFVAVEHIKTREQLANMLLETRKVMPVNAVHARAYVSPYALLGHGNLLYSGATLGPGSTIGNFCILGANTVVENEAVIADYVSIGAGTVVNAGAKVAKGAYLGTGVTVIAGVSIGKNARVGAGSVVMADIPAGTTVFGVPAKEVTN